MLLQILSDIIFSFPTHSNPECNAIALWRFNSFAINFIILSYSINFHHYSTNHPIIPSSPSLLNGRRRISIFATDEPVFPDSGRTALTARTGSDIFPPTTKQCQRFQMRHQFYVERHPKWSAVCLRTRTAELSAMECESQTALYWKSFCWSALLHFSRSASSKVGKRLFKNVEAFWDLEGVLHNPPVVSSQVSTRKNGTKVAAACNYGFKITREAKGGGLDPYIYL